MKTNMHMLRHIIVKLLKAKDKEEKILKKEKNDILQVHTVDLINICLLIRNHRGQERIKHL